jgi:ATP-binding cassette subfamily B protein
MDCGPTCLRMIAQYHGKLYPQEFLREKTSITRSGVSFSGIAEAAEMIGMQSLALAVPFEKLAREVPMPCIAYWRQRHFIVIRDIKPRKTLWNQLTGTSSTEWEVQIADPAHGLISYTKDYFMQGWVNKKQVGGEHNEGLVMILEPTPEFYAQEDPDRTSTKRSFGFLWAYFSPYKKLITQLFIGLIVGSLIQFIFPFLMQSIVDYGVNYQNINFIYLILLAQLVLFLSSNAVQLVRGWLLLHITSRISIRLLSNFLAKLMNLSLGFFDTKNTGDILQRIQDNRRIETFLSSTTLNTLFSFFNLFIFGVVLAYYNLNVFLIFVIASTVQIIWTLLFLKKRAEIDYKRFDQASGNQSSTMQLIQGMQEIKLNNSDKRRRWEWEAIQVRLFRISIKGLILAQTQNTGGSFINELKNILITFLTASAVISGQMTLGIMLAIQYIIGQLNLPVSNFISFVQAAQDAKISLDRLNEIYEKEDEENKSDNFLRELPADKSIYIRNLNFRYGSRDSPLVLDNLNFTIPAGKVTAIVGASGSGKTTLIKLLLQFYKPSSGSITLGRTSLHNISPRFWRSVCGSVMQDGYIFADSIIRNITESDAEGRIDKQKAIYASNVAHLDEFIESLPMGYNTRIGASGMGISGGQRQRVLIARAVYKSPEYIFLDEATSALDANNERGIMEKMESFYKNRTVLVVAHRLSTVSKADNIIVLNKGRIVEQGTHQELVSLKGAYYTLVRNQLELGK